MSELLYGRHAVLEALRAGRRRFYRLWLEGDENSRATGIVADILAAAQTRATPVRYLRGGIFDKLRVEQINSQGVALESDDYPYVECGRVSGRGETRRRSAAAADPRPSARPAEPGHADPHRRGPWGCTASSSRIAAPRASPRP
jgi:hypothetical protein